MAVKLPKTLTLPSILALPLANTLPSDTSALLAPNLKTHELEDSVHNSVAFAFAVPLSISKPDVPSVTPLPVSPLFSVTVLSSIVVLLVARLVTVPFTVKLPLIVASAVVEKLVTVRVSVDVLYVKLALPTSKPFAPENNT